MRSRVQNFLDQYNEMFNEEVECVSDVPPNKKKKVSEVIAKPAAFNKEEIRKLVEQEKVVINLHYFK